jgi:hypothetical protein
MPLDHSRRFDEYQSFEDLRPRLVKPNPQEPVGGKEPKSVRALPAQDDIRKQKLSDRVEVLTVDWSQTIGKNRIPEG